MDKEQLKQIAYLKKEIETTKKQIESIGDILLMDKVKGSSCHFPYTERSFTIVGVEDTSKADRLQRKLNRKIDSLMDLVEEINEYIDDIPDSLTRQVISLKYINGLHWGQVAESIGGNNTEDSVRKVAERFLKWEGVENMNEELKKALLVLLYDQFDIPDMELSDSEETYIEYIISALIEKNENKCPFKCYDCIGKCKVNRVGCVDGLLCTCDRDIEEVWREFISI